MALTGSLDSELRRAEIVSLARVPTGVSIEELAERFAVSTMTIRRDLGALEEEGQIRRVRGGAIAVPAPRQFGDRLAQRADAKRTIARKALALVPQRGVIALDASTTITTLAGAIGGRDGLTVCTNAPQTFTALTMIEGVRPLLSGGAPEPVTGSLVGPLAVQGARVFRTEVFFSSAAAVDVRDGGSEVSLEEAEVKRVFSERADRVVLCADSSKLGVRELARSLPWEDVSALVTELDPDDPRLDAYRGIVDVM